MYIDRVYVPLRITKYIALVSIMLFLVPLMVFGLLAAIAMMGIKLAVSVPIYAIIVALMFIAFPTLVISLAIGKRKRLCLVVIDKSGRSHGFLIGKHGYYRIRDLVDRFGENVLYEMEG